MTFARRARASAAVLLAALLALGAAVALPAAGQPAAAPGPLSEVPIPEVPGLLDGRAPIVVDRDAAVVLGKAWFWDSRVGSDGMACASCHFHAGSDGRLRNVLSPGFLHEGSATGTSFEPLVSGRTGGPNHALEPADLPFRVLSDPSDRSSPPLFASDDVVSSAGTFGGTFEAVLDAATERCSGGEDPVFQIAGVRTRRVEPRHAPTVINAVFHHRQFWDGRANNVFNGQSPFGPRDPAARVYVRGPGGRVRARELRLENASLASQALGPPTSDSEMSCSGRTLPDIGRKLLGARALALQEVHEEDGVLGAHRDASGAGLRETYRELVQRAFHPRFWDGHGELGAPAEGAPYDHMEANFGLFFGLAIQLYESTLVSDQSPFDASRRDADGLPIDLPEDAQRGLAIFLDKGRCAECHTGSELTAAAVSQIVPPPARGDRSARYGAPPVRGSQGSVVDRVALASGELALVDRGYTHVGLQPPAQDRGVARTDPLGVPLSYSIQLVDRLAKRRVPDGDFAADPCLFDRPFPVDFTASELRSGRRSKACASRADARVPSPKVAAAEASLPERGRLRVGLEGALKVPALRNVELTGPYLHDGSLATLRDVIDFYDRGGNLSPDASPDLSASMARLSLTEAEKDDLEAFLRSLTDERVRWQRAPFDHPSLAVPDGHVETGGALEAAALPGRSVPLARDRMRLLPAVGASGLAPSDGPLLPFESRAP